MIDVNSVDELIDVIKKNSIAVYGTGYVAEHFIQSLQLLDLGQYISFCVVTSKNEDAFMGYEVIGLDELNQKLDREVICIAVHESIKEEVTNSLKKQGFSDYVWIYPFQHKLRFGLPVEYKNVDISKLLRNTKDDYRIDIRIAAIEQYYGKNSDGYEIYLKAQKLHCNANTANSRLRNFIKLIKCWDERGFLNDERPAVSYEYEILDGVHRIALAIYHGMNTIPCDIYVAPDAKKYRNEYVDVSKNVVYKANYTEAEFSELERIHEALYAKY